MSEDLSSLFVKRRSIYHLGNETALAENDITEIITHALKFCPSAFNSQSARVVVLYGEHYRKFWDIVLTELSKIVPDDKMPQTIEKVKSFTTGIGTILFLKIVPPLKICKKVSSVQRKLSQMVTAIQRNASIHDLARFGRTRYRRFFAALQPVD